VTLRRRLLLDRSVEGRIIQLVQKCGEGSQHVPGLVDVTESVPELLAGSESQQAIERGMHVVGHPAGGVPDPVMALAGAEQSPEPRDRPGRATVLGVRPRRGG